MKAVVPNHDCKMGQDGHDDQSSIPVMLMYFDVDIGPLFKHQQKQPNKL
jgi:hypothetical protein